MARLAPDDVARLMTVGEVAARSGVAVSALHFYESKRLIASIRSAGNQRRYPRAVLRRVALIKVAQRTGMSTRSVPTDSSPGNGSPGRVATPSAVRSAK